MAHEVTIRVCSLKDVDIIVFLGRKTFYDTFGEMNSEENMTLYLDSTYTKEKITREFDEPGAVFFLAEIERTPVGFAKVRSYEKPKELSGKNPLEIERIYAIKDQIGKGVGKKLMETCIDHAVKNNYDTVWLGVWEHNARAISFYKSWGFVEFGNHIFTVGNDPQTDILMKKQL